jgi:hypothetical protein
MSPPKVFHGARALFQILDPNTGQPQTVGIFDNCSYSLTYDVQPAFILGRFSPAELGYTAQEPVNITCSGWRVINHGPHQDGHVPHLQDLLLHQYITMQVVDRQTGNPIAVFNSVRPTGYNTSIQARQLETMTLNFMGLLVDDESGDNAESVTPVPAADLP